MRDSSCITVDAWLMPHYCYCVTHTASLLMRDSSCITITAWLIQHSSSCVTHTASVTAWLILHYCWCMTHATLLYYVTHMESLLMRDSSCITVTAWLIYSIALPMWLILHQLLADSYFITVTAWLILHYCYCVIHTALLLLVTFCVIVIAWLILQQLLRD